MSPEKENGVSFLALNMPFTTCKDSLNLLSGFSMVNFNGERFIASPVPSPTNALPSEIWFNVKAECAIVAGCLLDVSTTVWPILQSVVRSANAVSNENDSKTGALLGIIKWSWYQIELNPDFSAKEDLEIRGPGEILGKKQKGDINFKIANITRDYKYIKESIECSKSI